MDATITATLLADISASPITRSVISPVRHDLRANRDMTLAV
jgi:hypothetical protein